MNKLIDIECHGMIYKNISIKTPSDLKYWYYQVNPDGHFFDRKTMQFFGDTMKNYKIKHHNNSIELIRKNPVKHGLQSSHFFNKENLADISTNKF